MDLERLVPGLASLRAYQASLLPHDLAAGLTLGAVLVPVGLAYGEMAGMPLAGLYGSMLPLLAYALFGSSRQLVVGPDTAMSAIVAVIVVPMAAGDPARLAFLVAMLGIMVGLFCIGAGLLRLGFVADLLSKPVIVGFMHGLAMVIAVAQLPKVLGIKGGGETTLEQIAALLPRLGETNPASLGFGAATFVLILGCRRYAKRIPGAVVALVASGLLVAVMGADRLGIAVVGHIPTGLPDFVVPVPSIEDIDVLLPVALMTALLSFSDTMVTARAFAARNGYRVDSNQELVAIGAANLASGVTQGLPISASDSRTAVVEASGGRTQMASVVAAAVVAGVMIWLAGLLHYLPSAVLGGVLMASAWTLCEFGEFGRLWRFRGISLAAALVTLAGAVALGVMEGILIGVVFSLLLLLRALAFPPDAVLGRTPDGGWHDTTYRPDAEPQPGVIVYRFSAPLFFANCNVFREKVEALIARTPGVTAVIVEGSAVHDIELTAIDMLVDLDRELGERGIRLLFGNLRTRVQRDIERGLPPLPDGGEVVFPSVADAVAAASSQPPPVGG